MFFRDEADLEPSRDIIRYNGYEIRVNGRNLLLESLYTNCDQHTDFPVHSLPIRGGENSETCMMEKSRIRIGVKVIPNASTIMNSTKNIGKEPKIEIEEGKWTLFCENGTVEIYTPEGVSSNRLKISGPVNQILLIDAP